MKKRYFFDVFTHKELFGKNKIYGNSTIDTENERYIQLQNIEQALLAAHTSVEDYKSRC